MHYRYCKIYTTYSETAKVSCLRDVDIFLDYLYIFHYVKYICTFVEDIFSFTECLPLNYTRLLASSCFTEGGLSGNTFLKTLKNPDRIAPQRKPGEPVPIIDTWTLFAFPPGNPWVKSLMLLYDLRSCTVETLEIDKFMELATVTANNFTHILLPFLIFNLIELHSFCVIIFIITNSNANASTTFDFNRNQHQYQWWVQHLNQR